MKTLLIGGLLVSAVALAAGTARSPFDLEIPPPETIYPPVLKSLPGSLPEYQMYNVVEDDDGSAMVTKGLFRLTSSLRPREFIRVFAADGYLNGIGYTLEPENETGLPMNFQYIFVKVKKGEAQMLDKLLIVTDRGPLEKVFKSSGLDVNGNLIQIKAEIQLTSPVTPDTEDSSYDFFRARVLNAVGLSQPGDMLLKGELQSTEYSAAGPRSSVVSDIIGGENEERSALYGQGNFVFINKGSDAGVKVGDIMPIYINRTLRTPTTPIVESTLSQGLLKVVHCDKEVSTALVVQADTGLRQGDKTGAMAKNDRSDEDTSVEDFELDE